MIAEEATDSALNGNDNASLVGAHRHGRYLQRFPPPLPPIEDETAVGLAHLHRLERTGLRQGGLPPALRTLHLEPTLPVQRTVRNQQGYYLERAGVLQESHRLDDTNECFVSEPIPKPPPCFHWRQNHPLPQIRGRKRAMFRANVCKQEAHSHHQHGAPSVSWRCSKRRRIASFC